MIGQKELATVQPEAILVNTSEAELVDAPALRLVLIDGRLTIAAIDGYYVEPPPTFHDDPYSLLGLGDDSFMVTPHTANATEESFGATLTADVESIANLLETEGNSRVVDTDFRSSAHWFPVADVSGNR